ncbi:MAG: DUF3109 family protein [Bacteroidetes bacterium]|nr:DUF3109 family protein [Bacteroidota bacterium]
MKDSPIIAIGDILVSPAILTECFTCDITYCKGECCVAGNSGAPLNRVEINTLEEEYPNFKDYMSLKGREAVQQQGFALIDRDGEWVTPLIAGGECAYALFNRQGVCCCAIEQAFGAKKTAFRKPVSCWLYPVRVQKLATGFALNYHQWEVCTGARIRGEQEGMPVYRFLKEPLIVQFGSDFYDQLKTIAEIINT